MINSQIQQHKPNSNFPCSPLEGAKVIQWTHGLCGLLITNFYIFIHKKCFFPHNISGLVSLMSS